MLAMKNWETAIYTDSDLHQSEEPSRFELLYLYDNDYNGQYKTFMKFINLQNCIRETRLVKLFIQCRNQF